MALSTTMKHYLRLWQLSLWREWSNVVAGIDGGTLLTGKALGSQQPLAILFLGTSQVCRDLRLWFSGEPRLKSLSPKAVNRILRYKDVDGVVIEKSWYGRLGYGSRMDSGDRKLLQSLIDFEIRGYNSFDSYLGRGLSKRKRNNVRRALKSPFGFRPASTVAEQQSLYHHLLVPTAQHLHGANSQVLDFSRMLALKEKFAVLLTERQGEVLVANFVIKDGNKLRLWRQGLADTLYSDAKLRSSAITFADAQTINYAFEQGCSEISFGKSACLSSDGGYWNKASWGCLPQIDKFYPFCYLYTLSPAMTDACEQMGLLDLAAIEAMLVKDSHAMEKTAA